MHKRESFLEMKIIKWDFEINTNHPSSATKRQYLILLNKKNKTCHLLDFAIQTNHPKITTIRSYLVLGGAHGVFVIVVGNEHGDTSSNPGRD